MTGDSSASSPVVPTVGGNEWYHNLVVECRSSAAKGSDPTKNTALWRKCVIFSHPFQRNIRILPQTRKKLIPVSTNKRLAPRGADEWSWSEAELIGVKSYTYPLSPLLQSSTLDRFPLGAPVRKARAAFHLTHTLSLILTVRNATCEHSFRQRQW